MFHILFRLFLEECLDYKMPIQNGNSKKIKFYIGEIEDPESQLNIPRLRNKIIFPIRMHPDNILEYMFTMNIYSRYWILNSKF